MEQIILSTNLRFVTAGLSAAQKGELFQALLEQNGETLVGEVQNIYRYIITLQQEFTERKRRMKELSAKAAAVRKKAAEMDDLFEETPSVTDGAPAVNRADEERKEAKENNNLNINKKIKKIFISATGKKEKGKKAEAGASKPKRAPFVPPLAEDVREFVAEEGLCVNPDEFVDFYDSHGWMVGTTAIRNWKATVRLWHRRAVSRQGNSGERGTDAARDCHGLQANLAMTASGSCTQLVGDNMGCGGERKNRQNDDETYWHELTEKTRAVKICPAAKPPEQAAESVEKGDDNALPDLNLSPFARYMRRIEDNDV